MNKFEEFTQGDGSLILLNTETITNVFERITETSNTFINTRTHGFAVKETYIEVFERLQ